MRALHWVGIHNFGMRAAGLQREALAMDAVRLEAIDRSGRVVAIATGDWNFQPPGEGSRTQSAQDAAPRLPTVERVGQIRIGEALQ